MKATVTRARVLLLTLALIPILGLTLIGYWVTWPGTTVGGVPVGGMTRAQVASALGRSVDWSSKEVRLVAGPFEEIALLEEDLGVSPDIAVSVDACFGPIWSWRRNRTLPILPAVDPIKISAFALRLAASWNGPVKDASYYISEDGKVQVSPHRYGCDIDGPSLALAISDRLAGWASDLLSCQLSDQLPLTGSLEGNVPATLELPVEITTPLRLTSDLETHLPLVLIAKHTTYYADGGNRAHNIALASEILSPTTVWDGSTFSFNDATGPRNKEMGYLKAGVIVGGGLVDDYGGGVCQVSTTLYIAMLEAGLQVRERYAHGLPVSYVPLGWDATVSYGYLDLKMKNASDSPYVFDLVARDGAITARVFGRDMGSLRIAVESSIVKEIPAEPALVGPSEANEPPRTLRSGYLVETRLRYFDGDKLLRTERIGTSLYPPEKN